MQTGSNKKTIFSSALLRLAILMVTVIFLGEIVIMLVLTAGLSGLSAPMIVLIGALILTAIFLPIFWWLLIRPLRKATLREQARTDEVRVQSAHDWEDTFNTITDMITIHDKDYTIIFANRAAREKLNLDARRTGGVKCFQLFHGTDCPPQNCPSCRSMTTAQPVTMESFEPHLNMYVETRAIPRFDAENRLVGLIHVVRDITARKRMEASLENQKRFAENLVQNSAVATFVLNPQHKVVLWNKACEELTGAPATRMIGTDDHWKPFYEMKRPTLADIVVDGAYEGLSSLYGNYSRSTLVANGVHAEGWFLNINGKNRYIVFDAAPIYSSEGDLLVVIETLQDIPERKLIEDELARSESKLRTLIEADQDCVTLLAADGTLLEMNPAGLKMVEADSLGRVAGTSFYRLVLQDYRPQFQALIKKVFDGESGCTLEFEVNGLKGTRRWVETYAVPLKNGTGGIIAFLGVTRDITDRKKLEDQLRHAQKMEAVGTLTGGIAHDFNNILTSIIGYGELLRMTSREDVEWTAYLDHLLASADRATSLTQNLLAFSRKQLLSPKPIDLNTIIRRLEKLVKPLIGEDIEIQTRLAGRALTALADAGQIEQVLMNLVVNARDAMHGGGTLLIGTDVVEIDSASPVARGYGKVGTYICISVTDTGTGMNEHTRQRVFEPFYTTKEVGKGTGLGLSIAYGIVKQHQGYIDCASEPGKGTTFTIHLPLIGPETEQTHQIPHSVLKGGTETVLVTEDDAAVRWLTRTMLEKLGYSIIEAANGEEALEAFREHKDRIDLLLFDVIMPKQNGKQAYDEIRKIRPDIKTLFMSGYTADVISSKGMLEQGMNFIPKPASLKELSEKVREVLDAV